MRKVPVKISTFDNFLDMLARPTKCGEFTKMCWRARFWKVFASKISLVAMETPFSTLCVAGQILTFFSLFSIN